MAAQSKLGIPGLPQGVRAGADLRRRKKKEGEKSEVIESPVCVFSVLLTSYDVPSASLATVSPASSPRPSSWETASST